MKAILLNGSPKAGRNTSQSLGSYLLDRLAARGYECETIRILSALSSPERTQELFDAFDSADLVILAAPLYVDSLPAGVILAMEKLAEHYAGFGAKSSPVASVGATSGAKRIAAILNCGFPEAFHNEVAMKICAQFARQMGTAWVGGLSLGSGPAIDGKPLDKAGGMVRNVIKSLGVAAEDLVAGREISREAVELMSKLMMPRWLYLLIGNLGWRFQARSYKATRPLNARPYEYRK